MRPNRSKLCGMSPSEFKTLLKRKGHKVPRDFFKYSCTSVFRNRLYRWRHWSDEGFIVDISCPKNDFDRWANSVSDRITIASWLAKNGVK